MDQLPITDVTVHRDGAIVVRRGRLPVQDGAAVIRRLPLLVDERTLRVEVHGGTLRAVRLALDLDGIDRIDETEAVAALRAAEDRLGRLEQEQGLLEVQRGSLSALVPEGPPDDESGPPSPEQLGRWLEVEAVVDVWATELDRRLLELVEEVRRAREERDICAVEVDRQSSEAWWRRWAPTRIARLEVDAAADEVEVALSYRIPGASWTPCYALHSDAAFRRGRFVVRALVAQSTGEDWRDARLSLSTAPCRRTIDVPQLLALRLGTAQPSQASPWRELPSDLDELFPRELIRRPPVEDEPAPAPQPAAAPLAAAEAVAEEALDWAVGDVAAPAAPLQSRAVFGGRAPKAKKRRAPPKRQVERALDAPAATEDGELDVDPALLDYPRLRLASWDHDQRGRLYPFTLSDEVLEAGLPPSAVRYLRRTRDRARKRATSVHELSLPPHHVLPGPIEGADFRFDAEDGVDVPSDGRFHGVALRAEELSLDIRYRTVAVEDPRAFRTVIARLSLSQPLPPGPIDVFVHGALQLTAPWSGSPGGGLLEVGLGVEDGLRVARNVRYHEESAGIFGGDRRMHTEVDVDIASSLSRLAEVEVLERVPVGMTDDIKVDLVDASPQAEEWPGEPDGPLLKGAKRQVVQVPAGGRAHATLHYAVTVAARNELVGGDRRG